MNIASRTFAASLLLVAGLWPAVAQDYPNRVITMIVPFAAGGPGDTIARVIAESMRQHFKQTIIIENVLGAGGTIGTARVAKAAPDGYTILLGHTGQATSVSMYRKLPYNPVDDFEKIGLVTDVAMTLVGKATFPPNTLQEVVAYVREQGDKVLYAHSGPGSVAHLCGLMFMSVTGTKMTLVPYKGGGQVLNDLLGGHVDFYCEPATGTTPHITAGSIKGYAVTTKTRLPMLPKVSTTAEAGFAKINITTWYGLYAPRGTPAAAVDKLVAALQAALKDPTVVSRFAELSMVPVSQEQATPTALDKHLRAEVDNWAAILKEAGFHPE
jgi:tripartite-type tricarboxylate transporter receptor subunit TctC